MGTINLEAGPGIDLGVPGIDGAAYLEAQFTFSADEYIVIDVITLECITYVGTVPVCQSP